MYTHAPPLSSGLGDSRRTASTVPRMTPIAMATTVSSSVRPSPAMISCAAKYWPTVSQWNRGLVTSACTSIANSTRTTAAGTHRPGCLTGTALISSGRGPADGLSPAVGEPSTLAGGPVGHRVGDRAALQAPGGEDLRVGTVRHQLLDRVEYRLRHPVALRDRDAVRRGAVGLPDQLERAVGLLDL